MDMALTHTLNAFALPLLVLVVTAMAFKGCLLLAGRRHPTGGGHEIEDSTHLTAVSASPLIDRPRSTEHLHL